MLALLGGRLKHPIVCECSMAAGGRAVFVGGIMSLYKVSAAACPGRAFACAAPQTPVAARLAPCKGAVANVDSFRCVSCQQNSLLCAV